MNDKIKDAFLERYEKEIGSHTPLGNILQEKIVLTPKHSPADVFVAYDEFFTPSKRLEYVEVTYSDKNSVSDFGRFYTDIYMSAFPDENERETFDNFLKYLKRAENSTEYKYHIYLAKDDAGKIVGGCVFDYFRRTNAGFVEFLAIRDDLQSCGLGSLIYKHVLSVLSTDAFKEVGSPLDYIFCEIDSPDVSPLKEKKYLHFWNKNKYLHLDFKYVQPSLSEGKKFVAGLWLVVSPQRASDGNAEMDPAFVLDVIYDYIKYCMDIPNPEVCEEYVSMKEELLSLNKVNVKKIV